MKKTLVFAAIAASVVLLSGCDMFRRMAGRPTSADIAEKKALIEHIEYEKAVQAEKARQDSLEQAHLASLEPVDYRFSVILGSFKDRSNAEKLAAKVAEKGFKVELKPAPGGLTTVAACPSRTAEEAKEALEQIKAAGFTQSQPWVLEKKEK